MSTEYQVLVSRLYTVHADDQEGAINQALELFTLTIRDEIHDLEVVSIPPEHEVIGVDGLSIVVEPHAEEELL